MFKRHLDNMRMEPTPERVLSICRLAAYRKNSREVIIRSAALAITGEKIADEISASLNVAIEELKILKVKDGLVELAVDPNVLLSSITFRRYVSGIAFENSDSTFFRVCKWYILSNERVYKYTSWEQRAVDIRKSGIDGVDENSLLGWRFWASFLGVGYLHDNVLIPNMYIRILDVISTTFRFSTFSYDERISAKEFLNWLFQKIPESFVTFDQPLPLALSNGIRILHELGYITLEMQADAEKLIMFNISGEKFNKISHITVKGGHRE
jgi:hypothetical protein